MVQAGRHRQAQAVTGRHRHPMQTQAMASNNREQPYSEWYRYFRWYTKCKNEKKQKTKRTTTRAGRTWGLLRARFIAIILCAAPRRAHSSINKIVPPHLVGLGSCNGRYAAIRPKPKTHTVRSWIWRRGPVLVTYAFADGSGTWLICALLPLIFRHTNLQPARKTNEEQISPSNTIVIWRWHGWWRCSRVAATGGLESPLPHHCRLGAAMDINVLCMPLPFRGYQMARFRSAPICTQ